MARIKPLLDGVFAILMALAVSAVLAVLVPRPFSIPAEGPEFRQLKRDEIITEKELDARVRAAEANRAALDKRVREMGLWGLFMIGVAWYFAFAGSLAVIALGYFKPNQTLRDVLLFAGATLVVMLVLGPQVHGIFMLAFVVAIVLASKLVKSRRSANGAA
jgi:hypothetical protein